MSRRNDTEVDLGFRTYVDTEGNITNSDGELINPRLKSAHEIRPYDLIPAVGALTYLVRNMISKRPVSLEDSVGQAKRIIFLAAYHGASLSGLSLALSHL